MFERKGLLIGYHKMKNQRKGKSIYVYPVLLIVLAILVNGCGTPARVHNMVATPHSIIIANRLGIFSKGANIGFKILSKPI